MKPIIAITFLITLMLMGAPMVNDTISHTGSVKGVAETSSSAGTQDAITGNANSEKQEIQPVQTQQNNDKVNETLPGKNTANLIIIL